MENSKEKAKELVEKFKSVINSNCPHDSYCDDE